MREKVKDYSLRVSSVVLGTFILAVGIALCAKADIGMSTFDALEYTIADVLGMKPGTFAIIFNYIFIAAQLIVEGKSFSKLQLLQFPNILLFGSLLNVIQFTVLGSVSFESYPVRFVISALSNIIRAIGITLILESNFIRSAMEGLVKVICDKRGKRIGRTMQVLDFVYVALSLLVSLIFKKQYRVREGTIMAFVIFGPCLDIFRKPVARLKKRYNIMS